MIRVIVAGDRNLQNYDLVRNHLDAILANHLPGVVIVSGAQRGADALGERYAEERGLVCMRFPADWDLHGRSAGPRRNREMAQYVGDGGCVVFDGGGKGSASMIGIARVHHLRLRIIDVRHEVHREEPA